MFDPETGGVIFGSIVRGASGEFRMQALRDAAGKSIGAGLSDLKGKISDRDLEKMKAEIATGGMQAFRQKMQAMIDPKIRMRQLHREGGAELVEDTMVEESYNRGGIGGRVEEYANGALEWVPNGPGDVPQPPTGDVFYDPIAEAQQEVSGQQKFARGGRVKKFQGGGGVGGLGAVAGPPEEEEQEPLLTVDEIISRTTHPGAGKSLTELIVMNQQSAIDRLRQGRTQIAERRDKQRASDESSKWLAFAQGMLAPTQTGGFGESLGATAGLLREEQGRAAEHEAYYDEQLDTNVAQEIAIEAKMIDQMLSMAGHANRAKGIHGAIQTMVNPEHVGRPVAQQQLIFGAMKMDKDGEWRLSPLTDENGVYFEAASRLDPARADALITAAEGAKAEEGRGQEMIDEAYEYRAPIRNVRRANAIFENAETIIETSGIQELKNRLANFMGIDFGDTILLTELQMIAAEDYLQKLMSLKGNTSDRDVREMKGISVGLGQNSTANYRRLKEMELIYSTAIRNGVREAYQRGNMDEVSDLWEAAYNNRWVRGAVPISSKAQYDKLKVGAYFFEKDDWGGQVRRKTAEPESGE